VAVTRGSLKQLRGIAECTEVDGPRRAGKAASRNECGEHGYFRDGVVRGVRIQEHEEEYEGLRNDASRAWRRRAGGGYWWRRVVMTQCDCGGWCWAETGEIALSVDGGCSVGRTGSRCLGNFGNRCRPGGADGEDDEGLEYDGGVKIGRRNVSEMGK